MKKRKVKIKMFYVGWVSKKEIVKNYLMLRILLTNPVCDDYIKVKIEEV